MFYPEQLGKRKNEFSKLEKKTNKLFLVANDLIEKPANTMKIIIKSNH